MTLNAIVREHLEEFWPDRSHEEFVWELGPIEDQVPGFRVRRIAPVATSDPWVYVTVGASTVRNPSDAAEFLLLAPSESPRHVETLAMVASYHSARGLGLGQTVDIGRSWTEGSGADHLLVSLPYPFGPVLEWCRRPGREAVRFLWLVPIYGAEARLVSHRGPEALEQLFDQEQTDVLAASRSPLA